MGPPPRLRPGVMVGLLALAVAGGGCALLPSDGRLAGQPPPMPECAAAGRFAFAGQATLAQLGLGDMAGPEANRPGRIWVTADPVPMPGPFGQEGPARRVVCVEWPDGGGMMSDVPNGWEPPDALSLGGPAEGDAGVPPLLLLAAAALAIGAVSFLAFRGGER